MMFNYVVSDTPASIHHYLEASDRCSSMNTAQCHKPQLSSWLAYDMHTAVWCLSDRCL